MLVSRFLTHMLKFCLLLCSLVLILVFLDTFLFLKNFYSIKYVLLAFLFFLVNLFGDCNLH